MYKNFLKRLFDFLLALLGFIVISPLFFFFFVLITIRT